MQTLPEIPLTEPDPPQPEPVRPAAIAPVSLLRLDPLGCHPALDSLAIEEPLEIRLTHGPLATRLTRSLTITMRTPGHDRELAAGFLLTEGVLDDSSQILRIDSFREAEDNDEQPPSALGRTRGQHRPR